MQRRPGVRLKKSGGNCFRPALIGPTHRVGPLGLFIRQMIIARAAACPTQYPCRGVLGRPRVVPKRSQNIVHGVGAGASVPEKRRCRQGAPGE